MSFPCFLPLTYDVCFNNKPLNMHELTIFAYENMAMFYYTVFLVKSENAVRVSGQMFLASFQSVLHFLYTVLISLQLYIYFSLQLHDDELLLLVIF